METQKVDKFVGAVLLLGIASLFLENSLPGSTAARALTNVLDYIIYLVFLAEVVTRFIKAESRRAFFRRNIFELVFLCVFSVLFIYNQYYSFLIGTHQVQRISSQIIILRGLFFFFKVLIRIRKLNYYLQSLATHPAQTIMLSFFIVVLIGAILLMMPFTTADYSRLGFINALFTATSATCVTGLIVVDTATKFSVYGKIVIMLLMQVGGLGIMILSAFAAFIIGKKISLQERLTLSYMLNEKDMRNLTRGVKHIVIITVLFELLGALALFIGFKSSLGLTLKTAFFSLFHAISAFCNAGFALFSGSFEQFRSSILINGTLAALIIAGGLGFSVIVNMAAYGRSMATTKLFRKEEIRHKLTLNTRVVLITSALLVIAGMFLLYQCEHRTTLLPFDMKTQYLSSFFQSVTLRTAGFNTMNIALLSTHTYLLMMLFMFIGGASGSTAGGIKVNTVGVTYGYLKSLLHPKHETVLMRRFLSKNLVNQAFVIILLSLVTVFSGVVLLTIVEQKELVQIMFEVVSAFGTVGLSTGITPQLTVPGKLIIAGMMFVGRIGPLTIITALSQRQKKYQVHYPEGYIMIG